MKRLIVISDVGVSPSRQRQAHDPKAHGELVDSLGKHGLLHPIVLRLEGDEYKLIAGERRLRALKEIFDLGGTVRFDNEDLPAGMVPYTFQGDLDELAAEEAELAENIDRADYTWQERAAATARVANLRRRQAEEAGTPIPTVTDLVVDPLIAKKGTEGDKNALWNELAIAPHLSDPDVKKAASLSDAMKVVKRKAEARLNRALAAEVGLTFRADLHRVLNCDSIQWMRDQAPGQFDVILTDPPYGIGADEFGDSGGVGGIKGKHFYGDSYEEWTQLMNAFPALAYRMAKPEAHAYVFCDIDRFHELRDTFRMSGWWTFRTPLIFHKPNAARTPWPENGPQRQYDLILYAVKGKKKVTSMKPDVLIYRPDEQLGHHAQKPVALLIDLLKRSVKPGDRILDPFTGSGSIFPAAHELKCIATGIEQDAAAYGIAVKRVKGLK